MIRFESLPPEVTEAMCTPMHLILPSSPDDIDGAGGGAREVTCSPRGALYVGGLVAAMDTDLLQKHQITHLVQVMDASWPCPTPSPTADGNCSITKTGGHDIILDVHRIDILDNVSADIRQHLDGACTYIEQTLNNGSNVLVHCHQGVSRSPSIVIAYLIRHHNMTFDDARALVKKRRPCIDPNPGFVDTLRLWEAVLRHPVSHGDSERPYTMRRTTA